MVLQTEAIKNFLTQMTHPDLAQLYNENMEVQVNVAQENGYRIDGEFKGKLWTAWSDGINTWKPIRIPYNAKSSPHYEPKQMQYPLETYAEGIGMTGWDWVNKLSRWVAYDFDAICGHSDRHTKKLTDQELQDIQNKVKEIEWVTLRKSTSGKGLHLYIFLDPVTTINHDEHSALARSILGKLSVTCLYDFNSKVDTNGGNMWIWHRKMSPLTQLIDNNNGLKLIKQGSQLSDIPINWKDHLRVVKGKTKTLPAFVDSSREKIFEELSTSRTFITLDEEHKKLLSYLDNLPGGIYSWDQDHKMLTTHTSCLAKAHEELNMRGIFKTLATGTESPDHNCYAFAQLKGSWIVRRFTPGTAEASTWYQDSGGWTTCTLNKDPDLLLAARAFEGSERPAGGFLFETSEQANKAAFLLGTDLNLPNALLNRSAILKSHKDGRLIAEIRREDSDQFLREKMAGWIAEGTKWKKVFNIIVNNPISNEDLDGINVDDFVRHLVTESQLDAGWAVKNETGWIVEPLTHVKPALSAIGLKSTQIPAVIGKCILNCWTIVNYPFKDEYPGQRLWNMYAPQLKYTPNPNTDNLFYPTWLKILNHCGQGLDSSVQNHEWCKSNNILTGGDYLKLWIASLFQYPDRPLPYLFLYGPEDSGKSILHEALSTLITCGFIRADTALINPGSFNAELEHSLICIVEEVDLRKNGLALNRIKDWVTGRQLSIHRKGMTPYLVTNKTHWIQTANDFRYCPIFSGDTRITMTYVSLPEKKIPKIDLLNMLHKEAPDFLRALLETDIPNSNDRLNVPVIITDEKKIAAEVNKSQLEMFLQDKCYYAPGHTILISNFFDAFREYCDPREVNFWTKQRISQEMPPEFAKGRLRQNAQWCYGNISFEPISNSELPKLVRGPKDYLVPITNNGVPSEISTGSS